MIMIEIQHSGTALLLLMNPYHIETMAPHALLMYFLKRRHFVASYVQPIIQQYDSTTV